MAQRELLEPAVGPVVARAGRTARCAGRRRGGRPAPGSSGTIWIADAPVPITATRLPARSTSWFQRAEWKSSPSKSSMPSMSGSRGSESPPAADDQGGRGDPAARRSRRPTAGRRRPTRRTRRGGEAEAVERAGALGGAPEVGLDLRLRGERHRPVGVGRERVRVELARHVAGGAGVGVVAPGAADVGALLDDQEVGLAVLLQLDRRAEAGEPGPDDQVLDCGGQCGDGGSCGRRYWRY